jgi:lipoprotein-anchoring transpeptidase ErfK/SrfK
MSRHRDVTFIRQQMQAAKLAARVTKGHVAGMAAARVFGPHDATTPEGHPILILSGVFDATAETPQNAIARAAYRWLGIVPHPSHWEIEMEEDVVIPPGHPMTAQVSWSKFWHLRYTPEEWKWAARGLHDGNVTNHFKQSWFLTRRWAKE